MPPATPAGACPDPLLGGSTRVRSCSEIPGAVRNCVRLSPFATSDWTPGSSVPAGRTGRSQGADDGLRAATRTVDARRQGSGRAARDRRCDGRQGHHPVAQGGPGRRDPRGRGRAGRRSGQRREERGQGRRERVGRGEAEAGRAFEEGIRGRRRRQRHRGTRRGRGGPRGCRRGARDRAPAGPAHTDRNRTRAGHLGRRRRERGDRDRRTARRPRGRARVVRRGQPDGNASSSPSWPRPWRAPGRRRPRARGWRRAARAGVQRRADRDRGIARPARRGLRLPADERVPARSQRRVRLGVPGTTVRAAQGRLRHGRDATAGEQREVPGPAAGRPDQRGRPGRRPGTAAVRGPHAAVPGRAAQARAPRRARPADRPHRRAALADRQGPARADRVATEGGQDHDPEADRVLDRAQQPRGAPHGAARRRAARRGHGHEAPRAPR